jgi:hypothetical protein
MLRLRLHGKVVLNGIGVKMVVALQVFSGHNIVNCMFRLLFGILVSQCLYLFVV